VNRVESGSEDGSAGDQQTEGQMPEDLPDEMTPSFDAISASCVDAEQATCSMHSAESCRVDCAMPEPCEVVLCEFDGATEAGPCEDLANPAALDCVFEAISEGTPMRFTLQTEDTYANVKDSNTKMYWLLPGGRYLSTSRSEYFNDAGQSSESAGMSWGLFQRAAVMACHGHTGADAFECLVGVFSANECDPPSAYVCPVP